MNKNYLGIVQNGEFKLLAPTNESSVLSLTSISMQEASAPLKLDLSNYEGKIVLVNGHSNSSIIYSAKIIEEAGVSLTNFLIEEVFNQFYYKLQSNNKSDLKR